MLKNSAHFGELVLIGRRFFDTPGTPSLADASKGSLVIGSESKGDSGRFLSIAASRPLMVLPFNIWNSAIWRANCKEFSTRKSNFRSL